MDNVENKRTPKVCSLRNLRSLTYSMILRLETVMSYVKMKIGFVETTLNFLKATLEIVYRFVRFQAVAGDSSCASGWKPLVFPSILRHKCRLSAHVSGGVSLDTRKFIPRLSIGSACCNISVRKCLAISRGTAVHLFELECL